MRALLLALLLALAVVFGGSHTHASAHPYEGAHAASDLTSPQGGENDTDERDAADSQGTEVAHNHVSIGPAPDARGVDTFVLKARSLPPIRSVLALPSLGTAPPLEPPAA